MTDTERNQIIRLRGEGYSNGKVQAGYGSGSQAGCQMKHIYNSRKNFKGHLRMLFFAFRSNVRCSQRINIVIK